MLDRAGSSRQCFEDEALMIFEISSADTGLNPDRVGICLGSITGDMALDVVSRILSILFWKKSANSSAENVLSDVVFGGLRRTPIFDQSTDGWISQVLRYCYGSVFDILFAQNVS